MDLFGWSVNYWSEFFVRILGTSWMFCENLQNVQEKNFMNADGNRLKALDKNYLLQSCMLSFS